MIEGCFELVGYPAWWSNKPNTSKAQTNKPRQQQTGATNVNGETSQQAPSLTKEDYEKLIQLLKSNEKRNSQATNMTGKVESLHNWIIDSGANDHITYLAELSKSMMKINSYVTIPNGKPMGNQ